jgi:hypothetical protein
MGRYEETIHLKGFPVKCEGNIEDWLKKLELNMQATLKEISNDAAQKVF